MTNHLTVTAPEGLPLIHFIREFDAPVEAVFEAHRDPSLVRQWLGPGGYDMDIETYDFRTGGRYRYIHRTPDGGSYAFHGVSHTVRTEVALECTPAIGYGPGSVNTSSRREIPGWIQTVMKPFFARRTREPGEVASQLVDLLLDPDLEAGRSSFADKTGRFPIAAYIADPTRQRAAASLALADQALRSRIPGAP